MWPLPRELLWAVIVALAIALATVSSHLHLGQQAPRIDSQQQSENPVTSDQSGQQGPAAKIDGASKKQDGHGGENASEITFLGIKPGEWLLGIVTWMLWLATVRLVKGGEETAKKQLRAYVLLDKATVKNLIVGEIPCANIFIRNFGQTPAYNLTHWAVMILDKFPASKVVDMSDPPGAPRHHIGAKARLRIIAPLDRDDEPLPPTLTAAEVEALASGQYALYVYGRATYFDCFGEPQFTEYCMFTGGPMALSAKMASYPEGHKTSHANFQ